MIPELTLAQPPVLTDQESLYAEGWLHVCSLGDLPFMEGRRTTIDGRRVAIFRLPDRLAAIDADCPHRGGPLQDGLVADSCVTCPLHDRRFNLDTGDMLGYEGGVAVHETLIDGALGVWVRLAERCADHDDCAEAAPAA